MSLIHKFNEKSKELESKEIDYTLFLEILRKENINSDNFFLQTKVPHVLVLDNNWRFIKGLQIIFYSRGNKIIREIRGIYLEYGIGPKNEFGICEKIEVRKIPFSYREIY